MRYLHFQLVKNDHRWLKIIFHDSRVLIKMIRVLNSGLGKGLPDPFLDLSTRFAILLGGLELGT